MAQQRYDIWWRAPGLQGAKTLFWGLTKHEAIGYIAAKKHMFEHSDSLKPEYYAVPMGSSKEDEIVFDSEHKEPSGYMKSKFEVCQSWDNYPQVWTVCFLTNYISAALSFLTSLNEFYDRDRHFCLRERGYDVMMEFLPRDHRKAGVC